jgi:hypothetical protein
MTITFAISGTQKAITPARSKLARSGATRSGWPLVVGTTAWLYALSNVARSGATRSNYTSGRGFVSVGGVHVGTLPADSLEKIVGGLTITDALNDQPNRCTFRVRGVVPKIGSDVIVTIGSKNNADRLFAGQILNVSHGYVGTPANYWHDVNAIDWTWGLNQRLVARRWTATSATTIAIDLVTAGAPGYGTRYIAAGLPALDEFTTTNEELSSSLTALARRIGGYWYVDYARQVHLFVNDEPHVTPPSIVNATHATLTDLVVDRDGSQLVTRVYVEAGGAAALAEVRPGETIMPIATASWYEAAGGVVMSGPQRIRYGGVLVGGGGSLVGPGAAPVVAPVGLVVGGSGIEPGEHAYAVSYVTAAGESLVGPRLTLIVGTIAPPPALTIGSQLLGVGPDPGCHSWAATFVTATGETTIGAGAVATIPDAPVPLAAPTPGTPGFGGAIPPGTYYYGVTFQTPSGESLMSPASLPVTMIQNAMAPPSTGPVPGTPTTGGSMPPAEYAYAVTFETATGQTTAGPSGPWITLTAAFNAIPLTHIPTGPTGTIARQLYRTQSGGGLMFLTRIADNTTTAYTDTAPFSALGGPPPATNTTGSWTTSVPLSVATGPAGTTARRVYRSGGGAYGHVGTIANNSSTSFTDIAGGGGVAPPSVNTAGQRQVQLTAIPIGGPDTTARRVYRTRANAMGPFGLALTLNDNTTTTATDTTPDASLGAAPPATATAIASRVNLTSVPIGPAATTARKLYRTKAGQAALQLLATIADNTTSAYGPDAASDATLGAAPPGADTSGLSQPSGSVNAGATSLIVAGAGAFPSTGGWAVIGNGQQVVRHTGVSGNTLTGIPASGPGSITASIAYNSTVTVAPALTGVPASGDGAIQYPIVEGDDVNLWIQVDDLAAQTAVALLFTSAAAGVHSGVIEDVIQDRRLSAAEARARGRAHLQQRRELQIRIRYQSRDINSRSGRPVTVNLLSAPYALSATFMIQTVRVSHTTPDLLPTFDVEASSERFSFEDLLRRWRDLPEG